MIGTRLGPYEITAKLGEGGMGEVYRATDTRLHRDVAIKVLPSAFTEDHERLARFEREAQLLAQLNHPNIAAIHGLEESGSTRALVMELVEGPTLADRLEAGALSIEESLAIARQIAEALEEAHEKGIVHRDLKPQNIKASREGKVKVLDFGLAKAMDPAGAASGPGSASQLAASPTLTLGATIQGVILGTAAYMSPEQAKGLPVDKRADIWAFGVVLYEMLTGARLFAADTVPETLAGVLKNEIDLRELPAEVPPSIRRLSRRCLERNPRSRLHDIADARIVLDEALRPGGVPDDAEPAVAPQGTSQAPRHLAAWAIPLLAIGAAAGWLASRGALPTSASAPSFTLRRLTDLPGLEGQPHLSPDGKLLVYTGAASGNKDVYVMRVDGGRALNLTAGSPADDEQAAFSPDGQRIAFRSSRDGGGLFVMGATGESVRRLTGEGFNPAWSPDGTRIAYSMEAVVDPYGRTAEAPLWIVDLASGSTRRLPPEDAVQPAWSPDGRRIAYWANDAGQRDLWTVPVQGGEPVAVTRDVATDWSPAWSPDGRWLYFSSDRAGGLNLFRIPIDPGTGGATGEVEAVTSSVGNLGWTSVSADGKRIVVSAYERRSDLDLYELTPEADPPLRPLRSLRPRSLHWCQLAPDAEWIACATIGTPEDLALLRADGSELRRLTDDAFKDRNQTWSPDGSRLVFQSTRSGPWTFWVIRADGSERIRLNQIPGSSYSVAWRGDGRSATVTDGGRGLVDLDVGQLTALDSLPIVPIPDSLRGFAPGGWSPSGRLLGGTEIDDLFQAISIGALDPETGIYHRSQLPMAGESYWRFGGWLPDSRRFVASGADQIALVDVETGAYRSLVPTDGAELVVASLSRDGRTLLVETPVADGDVWLLERTEGER